MIGVNEDQLTLARWIASGLAIPGVLNGKGDAGYLLNNMIAKFNSAADKYLISVRALEVFNAENVDLKKIHVRRRFYGKSKPYMYEHSIPASIVRAQLLSQNNDFDTVLNTLKSSGFVAVLLREENVKLRELKLVRSMPVGWEWGGDPLARYGKAGITLSEKSLYVSGAIMR